MIKFENVLQGLSKEYRSKKGKIKKLLHERSVLFLLGVWSNRFNVIRKQKEIIRDLKETKKREIENTKNPITKPYL